MIHQVNETIPVLAKFSAGRFEPSRFLWGGGLRKIGRVTGRWSEHDGQFRIYYFAVVSGTDTCYELSFHTRSMEWTLDKVMTGEA